jgi:hypothetical protein
MNRIKLCECGCGKVTNIHRGKYNRFIYGHATKGKKFTRLKPNNWKGGISWANGYLKIHRPKHHFADKHGYIRLHRFVYEYFHKCCLLPWGEIHHINGIKTDNHKHNIILISKTNHLKIHKIKDMSLRICVLCGSDKTYVDKRGYQFWSVYNITCFICSKCNQMKEYWLKKLVVE